MSENTYNLNYGEQLMAGREMGRLRRDEEKEIQKTKKNPQGKLDYLKGAMDGAEDLSFSDWKRYLRYAKQLEKAIKKQKDAFGAERMMASPARAFTSRLMVSCWKSIPVWFIAPFAIIWMDIHCLMRIVFPNVFPKLGEEWMTGFRGSLMRAILRNTGKTGSSVSGALFSIEAGALFGLNFLLFWSILLIIISLSLILYVISYIEHYSLGLVSNAMVLITKIIN